MKLYFLYVQLKSRETCRNIGKAL